MVEKFSVGNKNIAIYYESEYIGKALPVVYFNAFEEDGDKIYSLKNKEYVLVSISNIDWNREMSPWFMEKLFKVEDDYTGEADKYIAELIESIVPKVEEKIASLGINISCNILSGYSLAGLFSIYAGYKTDYFNKIVSCSGSLWYPRFAQFAKGNDFCGKVEKLYLSLGNKEAKAKNEIMNKVEICTKELYEYYLSIGIDTIYEENQGNHFQDVEERIAKGINWILS